MQRTKAFLLNSMFAGLLQVVVLIAGFITPRVLITTYGSEINGLVISITQFISYFNLVEAGLSTAAVYMLYKPLANNDYKEINGILRSARKLYIQAGVIFSCLVVILAFLYSVFIETSVLSELEIACLVLVLGMSGAINFFLMAKFRVLLTASQKTYVISVATIISTILNTSIIVILALFGTNIVLVKLIAVSSIVARTAILYIYVKRQYVFVDFSTDIPMVELGQKWDALYLQIVQTVQRSAPVIVATMFTDLIVVSVYSIYNMVFNGLLGILMIFQNGLGASFGDVIARKQIDVLQKSYREFEYVYYMIIAWMYSCALVLLMPFISIYTSGVTDANYIDSTLGMLFVLMGLLNTIKQPQGMLVVSAGLFKETRRPVTIQTILAIVCPVLLSLFWGLKGIILGMCISHLYRDIDLMIYVPRQITKLKILESLLRAIKVFIVVSIVFMTFSIYKISASNFGEWMLVAILVALYCFLVTVIINLITEKSLFVSVVRRIIFIVRR